MAKPRWCDHVEPATAVVACSGEQHRVSWRRGKLKLEDHDLSAERTMLAFGGSLPECLQVLQLWRNLHSWAMSAQLLQQMQSRLGPGGLLVPGDLRRVHDLGLLLTWERTWRRSAYFSDHGRLLRERLQAEALPALRAHLRWWMPRLGCRRISRLELEALRRGQRPTVVGYMDTVGAKATATLGVAWLLDVRSRGIEVVDGAFVLEVTAEDVDGDGGDGGTGGLAVRAVRWEKQRDGLGTPVGAPAVLRRRPDGAWGLAWEGGP